MMVEKSHSNLNMVSGKMNVLAYKGYHSGRVLKACEELNVKSYISPKESSSVKRNPDYAMENFTYYSRSDTYQCPAGERLRTNEKWYNKKLLNGKILPNKILQNEDL